MGVVLSNCDCVLQVSEVVGALDPSNLVLLEV